MSVSATLAMTLTTVETIGTNVPAIGSNNGVTHSGFNLASTVLTASSTPDAEMCSYFNQVLTAGAATVDLRELLGTNQSGTGQVDGNGKKVRAIIMHADSENGNVIVIDVGDTNGYELAGSAFSVQLDADDYIMLYLNDNSPAIGASDLALDLAGTGDTDSVDIGIVIG